MKLSWLKQKPDTFDYEAMQTCRVCDHVFKGRYCNVCGEKVVESNEKSLIHFLDSLLNAFTFLDGKFLKSFKLLLFQPGQLSRNIADGKRVPYMKMVSLFFVANFFYFLFPVFDSYNSSLYTQLNSLGNHSVKAKEIVKQKIEKEAISIQDFQRDYSNQSTNLSKLLIILLVFAFTASLLIINYSKKTFFFDHLLFSLEFYSFQLLLNSVILANLFRGLINFGSLWNFDWSFLTSDDFFSVLVVITMCYFLIKGQRTFYGQKWYWIIPKTIILIFLLQESVHLYRRMLFYITMWML
jgi:hypothetical protein